MAEEALLRSIIPAVAPAGHGLPQAAVFEDLDETQAGIVAALVAVNQRLLIQGNAVFLYQVSTPTGKCHFSPGWDVIFWRSACDGYAALITRYLSA